LNYELDAYRDALKTFPKSERVKYPVQDDDGLKHGSHIDRHFNPFM
jgi:cell fate regulator YaaT (PSP1 superfamily)